MKFDVKRNGQLDENEVHALRLAVGWESDIGLQKRELLNRYANFSVRFNGRLVGYLNAISDGVYDVLLNNLIVHPDFQGRGIAKALLKTAVSELSCDGLSSFYVIFKKELAPFYSKCGFHVMSSGVINLRAGEELDIQQQKNAG